MDFFGRIMKLSVSAHECIEIFSKPLELPYKDQIKILSRNASISVSFISNQKPHLIVEAPKGTPVDAVDVSFLPNENSLCCSVLEKSKSYTNITVRFKLDEQYKSLYIQSENGDIFLESCHSSKVDLETKSGDIHIRRHVEPCNIKATSINGDVTRIKHYKPNSRNVCICKTTNGDIVIE